VREYIIAKDTDQLVILGVGFDARAYIFGQASLRFFYFKWVQTFNNGKSLTPSPAEPEGAPVE
jgi:hypothetical protein